MAHRQRISEDNALLQHLMGGAMRAILKRTGPAQIQERYFANHGDPLRGKGGHVVCATTV